MTPAPARIGRYENPFLAVEWEREPSARTRCEPLQLVTEDHALAHGWLYARGGEDTVVVLGHPRANFAHHYAVPGLVDAGFAALCLNTRWLGNDATLVHERVLLDVAAALRLARSRFERVVLCGNSGGGSLFTFYLSQALAPEGGRLVDLPWGEPFDLNRFELPDADLVVYLAAHAGEGHYLLHAIDPSVTDERDPLSCDPALDPYDPANGFREPPQETRYAAEFLERYRAAQRARVARIDAEARRRLERRRDARERWRESRSVADRRAAIATEFLCVYRTDADPRAVDPSLDPSRRDYGSLWGVRPDWINYGPVGFARVVSPEAWLSTWSGLSSRAEIAHTGRRMTLPALLVSYAGDNAIFPSDAELVARSLATEDLTRVEVDGDHYGLPAERGRERALEAVVAWLRRQR